MRIRTLTWLFLIGFSIRKFNYLEVANQETIKITARINQENCKKRARKIVSMVTELFRVSSIFAANFARKLCPLFVSRQNGLSAEMVLPFFFDDDGLSGFRSTMYGEPKRVLCCPHAEFGGCKNEEYIR